jgi:hypothetical protein
MEPYNIASVLSSHRVDMTNDCSICSRIKGCYILPKVPSLAMGPTDLSVGYFLGLLSTGVGGENSQVVILTISLYLVPRLRMSGAVPPLSLMPL